MIKIEQEQVNELIEIVKIAAIVLPLIFGAMVWFIRRIDIGGRKRIDEYRSETQIVIERLRTHVDETQEMIEDYNKERIEFRTQILEYRQQISDYKEKLVNSETRIKLMQGDIEKLSMEINQLRKERDEQNARSMRRAVSFATRFGLTEEQAISIFNGVIRFDQVEGSLKIIEKFSNKEVNSGTPNIYTDSV